jgi:hypothetical protein
VPLPSILAFDVTTRFPRLVLGRTPGNDLGGANARLSDDLLESEALFAPGHRCWIRILTVPENESYPPGSLRRDFSAIRRQAVPDKVRGQSDFQSPHPSHLQHLSICWL